MCEVVWGSCERMLELMSRREVKERVTASGTGHAEALRQERARRGNAKRLDEGNAGHEVGLRAQDWGFIPREAVTV